MFAADALIEQDAMPCRRHPCAQLDVLDGRAAVPFFIEAAEFQKHLAPDRTAPAPEGADGPGVGLMHKMMEKIFVLREETRFGRGIVVSADHRVDGWV